MYFLSARQAFRSLPTLRGYLHFGTVPLKLSDIGEGIAEVEILKWHVTEGQKVSQFDKIVEVQSDKATVDITSRFDGTVRKLHYKPGDLAKTGTVLVELETEAAGDSVEQPSSSAAAPLLTSKVEQPLDKGQYARGVATPAVRRIAKEQGLTLSALSGTGKDGRVTKEDLLNLLKDGREHTASVKVTPPLATLTSASSSQRGAVPTENSVSTPLRGIQRAMAKSMTAAWTAPHFVFSDEIYVDKLLQARKVMAQRAPPGLKVTFLPIMMKALSLALSSSPSLNARLEPGGESLTVLPQHNVGVAMDTPKGLLVPVVKNVAELSVYDLAQELHRLHVLGMEGGLGEKDLAGATITLSNIGTIGGTYLSPVIPPGTLVIGALGRVQRIPRYASSFPGATVQPGSAEGDSLQPASILPISWSADHRVVEGATLARFSSNWKSFLEEPESMIGWLR